MPGQINYSASRPHPIGTTDQQQPILSISPAGSRPVSPTNLLVHDPRFTNHSLIDRLIQGSISLSNDASTVDRISPSGVETRQARARLLPVVTVEGGTSSAFPIDLLYLVCGLIFLIQIYSSGFRALHNGLVHNSQEIRIVMIGSIT